MPRSAISDLELVARAYAKAIRIEGATDRIAMQAAVKHSSNATPPWMTSKLAAGCPT
jgi:hypothetical protein